MGAGENPLAAFLAWTEQVTSNDPDLIKSLDLSYRQKLQMDE